MIICWRKRTRNPETYCLDVFAAASSHSTRSRCHYFVIFFIEGQVLGSLLDWGGISEEPVTEPGLYLIYFRSLFEKKPKLMKKPINIDLQLLFHCLWKPISWSQHALKLETVSTAFSLPSLQIFGIGSPWRASHHHLEVVATAHGDFRQTSQFDRHLYQFHLVNCSLNFRFPNCQHWHCQMIFGSQLRQQMDFEVPMQAVRSSALSDLRSPGLHLELAGILQRAGLHYFGLQDLWIVLRYYLRKSYRTVQLSRWVEMQSLRRKGWALPGCLFGLKVGSEKNYLRLDFQTSWC